MATSLPNPPPDGDRNRSAVLIVVNAVFGLLAAISVLARIYVRSAMVKNLGLDDLFILLGLSTEIPVLVMGAIAARRGVGRHQYYFLLSPQSRDQMPKALEPIYISQCIVVIANMLIRISIALFLLRLFGTRKLWRWSLYPIMVLAIITGIGSFIAFLLECRPYKKLWKPDLPGSCWGPSVFVAIAQANGGASAFCDCALASLPIAFMWRVQMSVKTKVGVCILMGMGLFTGVCAIMMSVLLEKENSQDLTWNLINLFIWGSLEPTIGIIAACIPTLRPLFEPSVYRSQRSKGWSRQYASDTSRPKEEDEYRLRNLDPNELPELLLSSYPAFADANKNHVQVRDGRRTGTGSDATTLDSRGGVVGYSVGGDGVRRTLEVPLNRFDHCLDAMNHTPIT